MFVALKADYTALAASIRCWPEMLVKERKHFTLRIFFWFKELPGLNADVASKINVEKAASLRLLRPEGNPRHDWVFWLIAWEGHTVVQIRLIIQINYFGRSTFCLVLQHL